jgi:hypothetical protein
MAMIISGQDIETVWFPAIVMAGGGVIPVPEGIHTGYFDLNASNVTFRGEGMLVSTMQFDYSGLPRALIDGGGSSPHKNARFIDLCFDGDHNPDLQQLIRAPGWSNSTWTFERCWFKNFDGVVAFEGAELTNCKFIDCVFSNDGNASGVGIKAFDGCVDLDIIGCTFNWLELGVQLGNTPPGNTPPLWPQGIARRLRFVRNRVRQDWWAIRPYANANATGDGSGGTLSFTATTLTDTAKSFTDTNIPLDGHRTIRVMQELVSSSTTNLGNTILKDTSGGFASTNVAYGDIIRTASAWTMVVDTISDEAVAIDGWRDLTSYLPVDPPAGGTAYKLYRIIVGETAEYVSSTVLRTPRWRDLLGNTVANIPVSATTRYEILGNRSIGGLHFASEVRDAIIADNVFHGCWSDQITVGGTRHQITNNVVTRGQDMGLNILGEGTVVTGGEYSYNGAAGIVQSSGNDVVIQGVTCIDNYCANDESPDGCDLQIEGHRTIVQACTLRQAVAPRDRFGIYVRAGATSVRLFDNNINGHYRQIGADDDVVNLTVRQLHDVSGPPISAFYPNGPVEI